MKRISDTPAAIARAIAVLLSMISGIVIHDVTLEMVCDLCFDFCQWLNHGPLVGEEYYAYVLTATIAVVIVIVGAAAITCALLILIASFILKRPVAPTSQESYPTDYYISAYGFTDDDRKNQAQSAYAYYQAYTIKMELTFEEVTEILRHMEMNADIKYVFPKSFLMPDEVSWFRPRIALSTTRRILKKLRKNGVVLLTFKYSHPKRDRIRRTDAVVRIKANLDKATYLSKDIFIITPNR